MKSFQSWCRIELFFYMWSYIRVLDVVFNEASTMLFSCGDDKLLIEWNVETGQLVQYALSVSEILSLCLDLPGFSFCCLSSCVILSLFILSLVFLRSTFAVVLFS